MSDEEVLDRMTLAEELAYACEKLEDLSKLRTKSKVKDRRESFMNSVKNVSTWLKPPPQMTKVVNQQLDELELKEEKEIRRSQLLVDKRHIPKRNKHTMAAIMDNYGYNDFQDIPNREAYVADFNWSRQAPDTPAPSAAFPNDDGSGDADKYNADNTQDEDYLCDKLDKCKASEDEELPLPPNTPADNLLNRGDSGDVELDPNRSEQIFQEQFRKYAYYARMMDKMEGNKEFDLYEYEEPVQTLEPSFQQNNYAQTKQKQHLQNYGPTDPNEAFNWRNMHPNPRSNPSSPTLKYPYSSKSIRSMNKNRRANNVPDDTYVNEPYNDGPDSDGYYMAIVKGRSGQNQYAPKAVETNNYYVQPQKEVKLIARQSALTSILTGDDGNLITGPLAVAMIKEHQKCSNKLFSSFRTGGEGRNSKSYINSLSADVRNMNGRSVSQSQSHLNQNFKVVDALSSPAFSKQSKPIYGVGNVAGWQSKQEPIEFTVGVIKHRPIIKRSTVAPAKTINSPNKSTVVHGKGDQTNGKGVSVRKAESKGNAATAQQGSRKSFASITGRKHTTTGTTLHMTPETKKYTTSARTKSTSKNNKTKPETDMRVGNGKVNSLLAKMMSPETAPYSIAPNETKITTKKLKIPNSTRL